MKIRTHHTVVTIFHKKNGNGGLFLFGLKKGKLCRGKWVPPGGHIEAGEDMYDAAIREGKEETGLTMARSSLEHVGLFIIRFSNGTMVKIDMLETRRWKGRLKPDLREFKEMRFFKRKHIPWRKMPAGDAPAIMGIINGFFVTYKVWCGKDRQDVRQVRIKMVPRNP